MKPAFWQTILLYKYPFMLFAILILSWASYKFFYHTPNKNEATHKISQTPTTIPQPSQIDSQIASHQQLDSTKTLKTPTNVNEGAEKSSKMPPKENEGLSERTKTPTNVNKGEQKTFHEGTKENESAHKTFDASSNKTPNNETKIPIIAQTVIDDEVYNKYTQVQNLLIYICNLQAEIEKLKQKKKIQGSTPTFTLSEINCEKDVEKYYKEGNEWFNLSLAQKSKLNKDKLATINIYIAKLNQIKDREIERLNYLKKN